MDKYLNILGKTTLLIMLTGVFAPHYLHAQQIEIPVACEEGNEPQPIGYGEHTTDCAIDPAVDLDRFTFCGLAGDEVRINAIGVDFMDPQFVIRDPNAVIIAQQSCNNGCSFAIDLTLPIDGCYSIFVSDVSNNETGVYSFQLEQILPTPENAVPVSYSEVVSDTVSPATDIDFFTFNGTAGTDIRLNVLAPDFMDPVVEIRDPSGNVVINGAADGALCNNGCSFSVDLTPSVSGTYSLLIYDSATNESGAYTFSLWCLSGPCDSNNDGTPDPKGPFISYDVAIAENIDDAVEEDSYRFYGTVGTDIRLNVLAPDFMDPRVEIRDPNNTVIINGAADGASCNNGCSFSVNVSPAISGVYTILIHDSAVNETGAYELSLWCLNGDCDSDNDGTPDSKGPLISYVTASFDSISPGVDGDLFRFNATEGTDLRLNVLGIDFMDPTVEIRDPTGNVVINGAADGASCNNGCSFSIDLSPAESGTYSLLIYDSATNESGVYEIGLWCLHGPCDSDADGLVDGNPPVSLDTPAVLAYGIASNDSINPPVDSDIFIFGGAANDLVQLSVLAPDFMDPVVEVRDQAGNVVIDGVADGASCNNGCSFSLEITLPTTGTYSLLIHDSAVNENGAYEIGLQCLIGQCNNAVAMCSDNCIDAPNGPLIPDAGGNIQLDTNGDGFGNACDPDLDNDGAVNFADASLWVPFFLMPNNGDEDFNGDGFANFSDYVLFPKLFLQPPGPACFLPANP